MSRWFQRTLSWPLALFTATWLFLSPASLSADGERASGILPGQRVRTYTSESGRFIVRGDDPSVSQDLLRWVEQTTSRFEDILQTRMAGPEGVFTISHSASTNARAGRVDSGILFEKGRRAYRMVLVNSHLVQQVQVEACLVRLLADYWVDCLPGKESTEEMHPDGVASNRVPEWLSEGIRQNLTAARKARNSEWVLDAWENGSVPPLSVFFARAAGTAVSSKSDPLMFHAQAGLLVGWLVSLADSPARFRAMQSRLADGLPLDHWWLATSVWGLKDKRDFDDAWDRWVLKQKHMVYQPGVPTRRAIALFRDELKVAAGKGGIPADADVAPGAGLSRLLDFREAKWLPVCVRHETAAIRLLSTGRGKELMNIADLYCRFLDGLDGWSGRERLERLLQEADARLAELESGLEAEDLRILNVVPPGPSNVFE